MTRCVRIDLALVAITLCVAASSCSPTAPPPTSGSGGSAEVAGSGGAAAGRTSPVGGTTSGGTTSGGVPAGTAGGMRASGAPGSGGTPSSGGPNTSGGTFSSAGTSVGTSGSGGTLSSGGTSGAGGSNTSGGTGGSSGTIGNGGGASVFPPSVTSPRIMIVGDSISAGPGCYKKYLLQNLQDNQITNYEFVGEYNDDCGGGVRHSAVSCTTSVQYTQATFTVPNCTSETYPGLATLVTTHDPDLILIQLGVNDVWSGSAAIEPILANYEKLIEQARAQNPSVVVMVAQIHKIITDNCQNVASTSNAEQLVMAVPEWAQKVNTAASPVLVADLWSNSDAHEADDCVHPNDAGARRMGLNWYNALKAILH